MNKKLPILISVVTLSAFTISIAEARDHRGDGTANPILQQADVTSQNPNISPARRIDRQRVQPVQGNEPAPSGFRNFNGLGNNFSQPEMGSSGINLTRVVPVDYGDGISTLSGKNRPSARKISNIVSSQSNSIPNQQGGTDFVWQWGQFLDHDIDLTDGVDPAEPANIEVPLGDIFFDSNNTGTQTISLNRSIYDVNTGTSINNPRQQKNEITSWIDASNVYGSDSERAEALRSNDGTGKLRTSGGNLLPFNINGLANAGGSSATLFLAGDVRSNEQLGLTTMHTLFMREHNRQAERIARNDRSLSGDQIYHQARRIVGAQMQAITYKEYLPVLLGRDAVPRYQGYKPNVNASINNVFSAGVYRYGHSALSPNLLRLDASGNEISQGHLSLRNAFFSPNKLVDEGGIEPILRGLSRQICQAIDPFVIDDVRNFLFGAPGSGGFDLASLNIQRGRDHGLPSYNDVREAFGLARKTSFAQISSKANIRARLSEAYASVDDIDVWVGGLSEDTLSGAMVGELISAVLIRQFAALRDGDRFWYQNTLRGRELDSVENTRLSDIIRRNTEINTEIQSNVFQIRG